MHDAGQNALITPPLKNQSNHCAHYIIMVLSGDFEDRVRIPGVRLTRGQGFDFGAHSDFMGFRALGLGLVCFRLRSQHSHPGRIYVPPFDAEQALEFDPATASWRSLGPRFSEGGQRYVAAVLASNGSIYALPCNAERILEISPLQRDAREVGPSFPRGLFRYQAAVVAPTGRIYGIPYDASRVLEFDPSTGLAEDIGHDLAGDGSRYAAAAVAENGLIYAPPSSAERVLEIDPWSQLVREVGPILRGLAEVDNGGDKYQAIVGAPSGKLLAVPYNAERILEIVPRQLDLKMRASMDNCLNTMD